MKVRMTKLLSILCLVAMLVSILTVPATAARPMMGGAAVEETPVGEVGTMPAHNHGGSIAERPELNEPEVLATVSAEDNGWVHDFTAKGTSSSFYTISGNLSSSKGTVNYDGKTLTQCLKIESATNIKFNATEVGTLKLVFVEAAPTIKLDGTKKTGSGGVITLDVTAGAHELTKADTGNLFYMVYAPSHTHAWGAWTQTKAPTCTEKGVETRECSVAGCSVKTETRDVDMIAHTVTNVAAKPATCVTDGTAAGTKCSVCGVVLSGCTVIPATGAHDFGSDNICKSCGMLQHSEHTWDAGEVTVQPTCTKAGTTVYHCTVAKCEETMTDNTVPAALDHDLQTVAKKDPTCTETGWDAYQACSRCDYSTKVEKKALGHTLGTDGKTCITCGNVVAEPLTNAGGWFETLYAVLPGMTDADVTAVSYSGTMNGRLIGEDFQYLVRDTADGVRVDIPGLAAGTYTLKVTAKGTTYEAKDIEVLEYDRSGYAHFNYTQGVGAYRDDGVLKENAIVLYVTNDTKNTVTVESNDGTSVTGIGHILNTVGMDLGNGTCNKGGKPNNNKGILQKLANDDIPLVVRIIGDVKAPDGVTAYDSVDYGGSLGDNGFMVRMKSGKNITVEGIGTDATINGWGMHFIASGNDPAAGRGIGFEVRNVAFRNVPEDCIGMEGQYESKVFSPVRRGWVHNCAFYAPSISNPAESDKAGGDGACDFKRGEYFTMDYCYYEGYHKTNLVGSGDSDAAGPQYHITWHHNYYKACESRGPLARKANMHIYNCIWDGQTSYVMDPRVNTYIFSEYNAFIGCKEPMRAGAIKSYNDAFSSCFGAQEGTIVTDKNQKVSSGNTYASFELDSTISYIPSGDYKLDKDHATARANIMAYTGPMKTEIIKPEDAGSLVSNDRTPTAAVVLPYDKELNSTTIASSSGTYDNIVFNVQSVSKTELRLGKTEIGQDIVFKVDEPVDITIADGGATTSCILVNEGGVGVLVGSGTAKNCPAGVYFIQPNELSKGIYKEAKITHLTITKTADTTPPHVHNFTGWTQTVAPSCTRTGVEMGTCSCGETETREVAKLDHNYVGGACTGCGVLDGTFGGNPDAPEVEVESLELDTDAISVLQGKTQRVIATVSPANATDRLVIWESDDPAIATVAKNGTITGVGPGMTTVTATAGNGAFTKTVSVTVIAVSTDTYTFSASAEGPKAMSSDEPVVATGSKWGTGSYFTNNGDKNKWKAVDFKGGKKDTGSLLLAGKQESSLDFTVSAGATATVTLNFTSTSSSNTSAIAILDASGNLVDNAIHVTTGTGTSSAVYELSAGSYKIVAPKGVQPSDVNDSWDVFPDPSHDDPNTRGTRLTSVTVVEEKVASGELVAVTGVTLDRQSGSVEVGKTMTLIATVTPGNATNKTVTWTTSNANVATVSQGTVTGRGVGNAVITATCGGKTATCAIAVTAATHDPVKVTSITITDTAGKTSQSVSVDGTKEQEFQLTRTVLPEDADNTAVTWSSDSVAKGVTVNSSGLVTVAANAQSCTAKITATAADGSGVKGTYTITVTAAGRVDVTDINIKLDGKDADEASVKMGKTLTLTAEVIAEGVNGATVTEADKAVVWSSSNDNIATVDNGVVTPVKAGTVTITAQSAKNDEIEDTLTLTVGKGDVTLAVEAENEDVTSDGGSILLLVKGLPEGVSANVTIAPTATVEAAAEDGWNYKVTLPANASETDDVAYTVTVSFAGNDSWNAAETVNATVYVRHVGAKVITITKRPGGSEGTVTLTAGDKLELTVAATVAPEGELTYAWSKDGVAIEGANSATYSKSSVTEADAGEYVCVVDAEGAAAKRQVKVAVVVNPKAFTPSHGGSSGIISKPADPTPSALPFVDVAEDSWYYGTVAKAFAMGLMKGTDATHFTPTQNTSRAMIATILYRLDGEKETNVKTAFDDVVSGQWYTEAVEWAANAGVVKGYDEDTFAPDDNITREQLAVMLYRYADPGNKRIAGDATLTDFVDAASVSDWAAQAMEWAVKCGIITGKGANNLDPQGLATRAEAVTMLMRFVDLKK